MNAARNFCFLASPGVHICTPLQLKEEKNDILDVGKYQTWYKVNDQAEAGVALLKAVTRSAKRRAGTSLFTSAIRSGRPTVIRSIAKGYEALQSDAKVCPVIRAVYDQQWWYR